MNLTEIMKIISTKVRGYLKAETMISMQIKQ